MSMTATTSSSFLDTAFARLIALVLAGLIAYLLYANWGEEIIATMRDQPVEIVDVTAPAAEATPALDACLARRVGDVETMKSDGIINDAQYASFKSSAIKLCQAQNPSSQ